MKFAFCFGNGKSRAGIDPAKYSTVGPTYGTNYMIQDYQLDNTIAADKAVVIKLLSAGYHNRTNLYTRKKWKDSIKEEKLLELPEPIETPNHRWDNEIHWGSGCHAVNLAASHQASVVVMIGFDLWGIDGKSNNMYYEIRRAVDPSAWIHQLATCFENYPKTQFVQIQPDDWKNPPEWNASNYNKDNLSSLASLIG